MEFFKTADKARMNSSELLLKKYGIEIKKNEKENKKSINEINKK